jgi:hypothetical protein
MRSLVIVSLLLTLVISASYVKQDMPEEYTIQQASEKGLLKLTIKGKGGYTGEVIEMKIKNLFSKKFKIKVPAGHRLDSKDSTIQDILVTRPEELMLSSKEERTITLSGMCCQAYKGSPGTKSEFKVGKMADSLLVKVAEFINLNKYHDNYAAQQAVWVVSDNNRMESISSGEKSDMEKIQQYISNLTGKPMPTYTIDYEQDPVLAFSGRPKELKGTIEYYLYVNALVTCGVYDQRGRMIEMFFQNKPHDPKSHVYEFVFHTKGIPKGTYFIRVYADGQMKKEQKVEL